MLDSKEDSDVFFVCHSAAILEAGVVLKAVDPDVVVKAAPGRSKFLDLFSKACNLRHMQSESHPIPALS